MVRICVHAFFIYAVDQHVSIVGHQSDAGFAELTLQLQIMTFQSERDA